MANTVADVLGISIGTTVEAYTTRMGLPQAQLTSGLRQPLQDHGAVTRVEAGLERASPRSPPRRRRRTWKAW